MSATPMLAGAVAVAVAMAVALGIASSLRAPLARARRAGLAALQLLAGLLFWWALYPPMSAPAFPPMSPPVSAPLAPAGSPGGDGLSVYVGAERDRPRAPWWQPAVALPGAEAPRGIERVPDLATALQRHPETRRLDVVGPGLPPRDLEAVAGRSLRLLAPPPPLAILSLQAPADVPLGQQWNLSGRVSLPEARVELADPAGAVVDSARADAKGRYTLSASARATGALRYELRVLDGAGEVRDRLSVPIRSVDGDRLRMRLVAGAPSPEVKYWRRWASDAGASLDADIALSPGLVMRDGGASAGSGAPLERPSERLSGRPSEPGALPDSIAGADAGAESGADPDSGPDPAALDLLVIDERGWAALDPARRQALLAAVGQGLGLLLRVSAPLEGPVIADWTALGFGLEATAEPASITLDRVLGSREAETFTLAPVALSGGEPLLTADDGRAVGRYLDHGRGRIGLLALTDSYRLVLRGEAGRYGRLWGGVVQTLARARASVPAPPVTSEPGWIGELQRLCDLQPGATVEAPGEPVQPLRVERGCAVYWPAVAGWHRVRDGDDRRDLYVRADDDGQGLRQTRDRLATEALARAATPAALPARLARWPFWLGWLLVTALIWAVERQRLQDRPSR